MSHPGESTVPEIGKMAGVADLRPLMCKGKFALALRAEAQGDHIKAGQYLQEAIDAEG